MDHTTKDLITKDLVRCHKVMREAIKEYLNRANQCNKLFYVRKYCRKLPEEISKKIETFVEENIAPMVYDMDYWEGIEHNEELGVYDDRGHFILDDEQAFSCILTSKYYRIQELLDQLEEFMFDEIYLIDD